MPCPATRLPAGVRGDAHRDRLGLLGRRAGQPRPLRLQLAGGGTGSRPPRRLDRPQGDPPADRQAPAQAAPDRPSHRPTDRAPKADPAQDAQAGCRRHAGAQRHARDPALRADATDRRRDLLPGDDPGQGATDGAEPSDDPSSDDLPATVALRVVDRPTSRGLLDTIVGGVTGFFFGG